MTKLVRRYGTLIPLFAGFLVLFAAAVSAIWLSIQQQESAALVRRTLEVENKLNEVLALAIDAETGQRGFLLTGRDFYLKPYDAAKRQLLAQIELLSERIADSTQARAATSALTSLAKAKLDELDRTISLRSQGKTDEALALVNSDSGIKAMNEFRNIISEMRQSSQHLLQVGTARSEFITRLAQAGFIATALLLLVVAYFAIRDAQRRLRLIQSANLQLEKEIRERSTAENQVRQLQKMEAIGQLTGGIAHDFNNMLSVVIGSLDIAKRRIVGTEHPQILQCIENASLGAERAAILTARLLAFSRQQPLEVKVVDANKLVGGMSELLRRSLGENIRIETVLAGGLWRTNTDPAQLESAVLNLAVNSRDAMPDGGRLTIETSNTHLDDAYAMAHAEVKAGQYVMLSVSDTGVGMPPEVVERAFDPFYTTKGVGKGTGLGLSQVFGFIKQSGGHAKIYSEPGHGTTLKIYLPRYFGREEVGLSRTVNADSLLAGSSEEIILVVEDETSVRHVSVDALRILGYTVVQASSAVEAFEQLKVQPSVKLLFTDIVMPDITGRQLADKAVEMYPALKVLYTPGYTKNAVVHNGIIDPGTFFIPKPFTVEQLSIKVRQVLDS